jgi:uncharacterized protein YkwD
LQAIASSTPRQPLAWNDTLAATSQKQSQDQANMGVQTHTGANGSDLTTRLSNAGLSNLGSSGENAFAYTSSVDEAIKAFLIDWGVASKGHRLNILQPTANSATSYNETGIGIVNTANNGLGPMVVTEDFAHQNGAQAYLLGVAYNDPTHSHMYAPGQGQGGVTISAQNLATGNTSTTQTWDAGGYQMQLAPGTYQVTALVGNQVVRSQQVTIGGDNVKVDFDLSDPWQMTAPPVQINKPAPAPVQAAALTPVATTQTAVSTQSTTPASTAPVSTTGASLTSSLFNPLGWITSWTSWKATNATQTS